jgi:hypothetical protein
MNTKTTKRSRLFYIDNLRILLTVLVIMHHLAIGYGAPGDWIYNENGPMSDVSTILMTLFLALNQSFFMGAFFTISSYFSPGSVDRRGSKAFLFDRLKRLGIPLIFYVFVINPLTLYPVERLFHGYTGTLGDYFALILLNSRDWNLGVMWFVATLLVFALVYVLWRQLAKPSDTAAQSNGKAPSNVAIAVFALALGVTTFVVRIWIPVGYAVPLLNIQPAHFVQYIALYVVGIIAYRRNWFERLSDAQSKTWRVVVLVLIVLFPVLFIAGGALEGVTDPYFGGLYWQNFAYSVWEEFMCVAMVVTLLIWFRKRFAEQGPLARATSGAAYATYVFHQLVIVYLAVALRGIKLDMALKYVLVTPFAVGLAFLTGYLVKKLPFVRDIL